MDNKTAIQLLADISVCWSDELREAVRRAIYALRKRVPESPFGKNGIACPNCGSDEFLYNRNGNKNKYCGKCGKRIAWDKSEQA